MLRGVKLVIVAAVVVGIGHFVRGAINDLSETGFSLGQIDGRWMALSAVTYVLGMLPAGLFWHAVLHAVGQNPGWFETLRAYFIGHLGKYVPGKAMVVVLRTGLIGSQRVDRTTAAVTVFTETLTQMAVGAAIAAVIIAIRFSHHWQLMMVAIFLAVCAGLPTVPSIFRKLVVLLKVAKWSPEIDQRLQGVRLSVIAYGWCANLVGWFILGFSLWAAIRALPGTAEVVPWGWENHLLVTAAVALAVVSGFLSLLPGGMGVRELVLISLLAHELNLGDLRAVVATLAVRLAWLLAELTVAGLLWWSRYHSSVSSD